MKKNKILAAVLAALMIIGSMQIFAAAPKMTFSMVSDAEGKTLYPGDSITFTVKVTENCGLVAGTLFFKPSESLEFVSATLLGKDPDETVEGAQVLKAINGPNEGAWGICFISNKAISTTSSDNYCSMTFRIVGLEEIKVDFSLFDGITAAAVSAEANTCSLSYSVTPPAKPVITTSEMSVAVMNIPYSSVLKADTEDFLEWELVSGELPEGLELLTDGTVSGTPTVFGSFKFTVRTSILGTVMSDSKEITLRVCEKPEKISLTEESKYSIDNDGLVTGVADETKLSDFIKNFESGNLIKVYSASGTKLGDNDFVGTGAEVRLYDGETVMDTVTVIVLGDVSGDGEIATIDYQRIRAFYLGKYELTGAALAAAHVAGNENVATIDYQRVRAHYLGKYNIFA